MLTRAYPTIIADPLPAYCSGSPMVPPFVPQSSARRSARGAGKPSAPGRGRSAIPRGKPIFFGLPGTASSRQRLFDGTGNRPQPLIFQVRPFEPWCEPTRARCIALPLAFAISQRRHPAVGPPAPQRLTGDDIAPSADLGISRRPSPPHASTRTLRRRARLRAPRAPG